MATFGYTTQGGSSANGATNGVNATRFTAPSDVGVVIKMSAYVTTSDSVGIYKGGIWLQSSLALVAVTNEVNVSVSGGLFDFPFASPPTLTPNVDYYLGMILQTGGGLRPRVPYDSTANTNYGVDNQANNYTTPTNLSADGTTTKMYSIFATYTPAAIGGFNIALV